MADLQEHTPKNIFPLHVLKVSENTQIMVELKSGETYNGVLKSIDKFMNIRLGDAYLTDARGEVFRQVADVYVRGNVVKYFTLEDLALKKIQGTEYRAPDKFNKSMVKYNKKDKDSTKNNKK